MNIRLPKLLVLFLVLALGAGGCASTDDEDETRGWSPQRLYVEAKDAMNSGLYEEAIKYFETLEARFPYGRYAQQAQLEVAYAYFKHEEPELAVAAAERFIRLHPTHPSVDYAYYLKGIIQFNEKRNFFSTLLGASADVSKRDPKAARDAYASFRDLVERFPDSRYAEDSRKKMAYLIDALARYELSVAQFYFRKQAYAATLNRCKEVLSKFQRTPAVEDALGLQMRTYKAMGMPDLERDTYRLLQTNFPDSPYISEYLTGQTYEGSGNS